MWIMKAPERLGPMTGLLYGLFFQQGYVLVSTYKDRDFLAKREFTDVTPPHIRAVEAVPGNILIARHGGIGDMLMLTPLLRGLRKKFPAAKLIIYCLSPNANLLQGNPSIDLFRGDILVTEGARAGDEAGDYYDLTHSIEFNRFAELTNNYMLSAARYDITVDSYAPEYYAAPGEREHAAQLMYETLGVRRNKQLIAVQFDASSPLRSMPRHHAARMLNELATRDADVLVFGFSAKLLQETEPFQCSACQAHGYVHIPADTQETTVLCRQCKAKLTFTRHERPSNIRFVGTTVPVRIVAGMLTFCDMFIGVDSGLMHVAAAQRVPTFLIGAAFDGYLTAGTFPNTHVHQQEFPCAPCHLHHNECTPMMTKGLTDYAPCMAAIDITALMARINDLLDHPEKRHTETPVFNWRPSVPAVETFRPCPFCETASRRIVARKGTYLYLRCPACLSVYTERPVTSLASYENSDEPIRVYKDNKALANNEAAEGREIAEEAARRGVPQGACLDVGCGYGFISDGVKGVAGWTTYGLDVSPFGLEECQRKGHRVVKGDLCSCVLDIGNEGADLLFLDGTGRVVAKPHAFNLIILSHVFEHFADQLSALAMIKNLLHPQGLVFMATPSADVFGPNDNSITGHSNINRNFAGEHQAVPTRKGMEHLLSRCGLKAITWQEIFQPDTWAAWITHA